jgi:hypothetical protein
MWQPDCGWTDSGWWWVMMVFMAIFWIAVIGGVIWLIFWLANRTRTDFGEGFESPLDILKTLCEWRNQSRRI